MNMTAIVKCEIVDFYGFKAYSSISIKLELNTTQTLNLPLTSQADLNGYSIGTVIGTNQYMMHALELTQFIAYYSKSPIPKANYTMRTEK